jgi:tripartite-type tricarboxylate transporter receptor subunit TctC
MQRRSIITLAALGLATVWSQVQAQTVEADWPSRPIKLIVPAPAGGAYDLTARPLAQELSLLLKQTVVVDNRPGAGNIVGTAVGARSAPDGYTVTMTGMLNTIAQTLYPSVGFDISSDFSHVSLLGEGAQWLVVRPDLGVNSFAELIERAKREPGKLNYATSGAGSTGHLIMELIQRATGTKLTHVPYKGGAPALQDVLAGVVPLTVVPPAGVELHVRAGKLKVLATSSAKRTSQHPEVATFTELGHPSLTVSSWVGFSVPKGTPPEIVRKLNAATVTAMTKPSLVAQLEKLGIVPMTSTPEAYAQQVRSDTERWGQLVRSLNLKAE